MEVDSSPKSKTILESQLFYSSYDVMVNLMICSVLSYLWSMAYHSVFPGANQSCLVVILLFVTGMFTLHSLLQIIYLTGLRAIETKLAITTGCFTFAANLILFALQLHAFSDSLTTAIGVHMQAMFMQLSPHMPIPSFLLSKFSAQIMLATLSSLIAACATFPAIRFAQSFVSIALVSDSSKVTTAKSDAEMRTMLWMDLLLPLFIAIICSPLPYWAYDRVAASDELCTLSPESAACEPQYAHLSSEGRSAVYECVLFNVQAVLVLLSLVLRVRCMRPHLQCFLDSLVKTVTEAMMAGQQANVAILHRKVKVLFC